MAESKHTHQWHVGAYVVPEEGEELRKVEVARHPATGKPFDLSNEKHLAFMDELGIDRSHAPEPREHKVIFDCDCGETRHVAMTKDGVSLITEALADQNRDPGQLKAEDLVGGRMPS
jgi:hypothetical protein